MDSEVSMIDKIETLESDLSNTKTKLELSNKYASSLEAKLNSQNNNNIQVPFTLILFIISIMSLFVLKLSEKKF